MPTQTVPDKVRSVTNAGLIYADGLVGESHDVVDFHLPHGLGRRNAVRSAGWTPAMAPSASVGRTRTVASGGTGVLWTSPPRITASG